MAGDPSSSVRARLAVALVTLTLGSASASCLRARPPGLEAIRDPMLLNRMPRLGEQLDEGVDDTHALALRYHVRAPDGRWTWNVVVGKRFYAERRTRADGHAHYAFGEDGRGTWLETAGVVRAADATWRAEARTRAALFGLRFLRPAAGDSAEMIADLGDRWEYAYRPAGGRTLTLTIDEADGTPVSFDAQDAMLRSLVCENVRWEEHDGHHVPVSASCRAGGCTARACPPSTELELVDAEEVDLEDAPAWSRPAGRRPEALAFTTTQTTRIEDRLTVTLDAKVDGLPPVPLQLDSGAFHTTISRDIALALGVIPTGETPYYLDPPWLPSIDAEVGVLPHATIGGVAVDGMRVLIADSATDVPFVGGLIGADFFKRAVVDIDSPAGVVRLVPRDDFVRTAEAYPLRLHAPLSRSPYVSGEVFGVDEGLIVLDTGASVDIVVHSARMASANPRARGMDVLLSATQDMTRSPDYQSQIDGLRIGPFPFPAMPAIGRDRQRERVGEGIALVGMGLMRHFRLAFDLRDQLVYAWPGPSYETLVRAGLEVEDDARGVRIAKVLPRSTAEVAGLREGDVLLELAGRPIRGAELAEREVASARGGRARLRVRRADRERVVTIALEPGWEDPRAATNWDWVR